MRVTLEVMTGAETGRTISVAAGPAVRFGRKAPSHVVVSGDPSMSRAHFALEFDGDSCRVQDLGSLAGTWVNGEPVRTASLRDGDEIVSGATAFLVRFDGLPPGGTAPIPTFDSDSGVLPSPPTGQDETVDLPAIDENEERNFQVLRRLRAEPGPLFAVLDAARDPLVLVRLRECKETYQSLFEGPQADRLAAAAPYLVALPNRAAFLETVVRDGWGKSWGVFLTSDLPFADVRKHLRRFLTVELDGRRKVMFRFFDPRVLRLFLPTCTATEASEFFAAVSCFLTEGEDPNRLTRYRFERGRVLAECEVPAAVR